jgi:N-acetylglucosaminyl-diphospho-decaprenol L-rhamnosyltransferase
MSDTPRADAPDVDVVIVAHDAGEYLRKAVDSVAEHVAPGRIVVVDAESSDGSVDALGAARPGVRVIAAPNRGFSASNNIGIAATSGAYVLLLNPDAELVDGSLARLVARAEADPRAGIVGPRVLDPDGGLQRASFGAFPTLASTLALHVGRSIDRWRGGPGVARSERTADGPVGWVTGACMLVRRSAIGDVGPMDEGFFLYFEDADWCHRMHDRGWRVVIEASASCVHHLGKAGGSPGGVSEAYRESFYRYCRAYHLWGLAAAARVGLSVRSIVGGRS